MSWGNPSPSSCIFTLFLIVWSRPAWQLDFTGEFDLQGFQMQGIDEWRGFYGFLHTGGVQYHPLTPNSLELIGETRTLKGGGFIPVVLVIISPFRNVTRLRLCVSQVTGVSWRPSLSEHSPWSWWLCSASTSECSAIDDFTSCRETLSFVLFWSTPIRTLEFFRLFPPTLSLLETDVSQLITEKKTPPRWSHVNFKYALSKRLHLSFTIRFKQMSESINIILLLLFKTRHQFFNQR